MLQHDVLQEEYVLRSVEDEGESQSSLTVQLNQRVGP